MTTRRGAIRRAVLMAMGMALFKMDLLKAQGGELTCDLGQWDHITFKFRGRTVRVPVAEVFAAIAGGDRSTT